MTISRHVPLHGLLARSSQLPRHRNLAELRGEVGYARYDREVRGTTPWMHWYKTPLWEALRAAQLAKQPRCRCGALAVIADHRIPHKGDWALFAEPGNLDSKCRACHGAKTARDGSRDAVRGRG